MAENITKNEKENNMDAKTYFLENLQNELKFAFKWMARATQKSLEGDFQMATYDMTVAMQHWIKCQNIRDKYIEDENVEDFDAAGSAAAALVDAKAYTDGALTWGEIVSE